MIRVNENFLQIQQSYLFGTIIKKVDEYAKENPDAKVIKLGVGDVTRPIPQVILDAMHKAVEEMELAMKGMLDPFFITPSVT